MYLGDVGKYLELQCSNPKLVPLIFTFSTSYLVTLVNLFDKIKFKALILP
jgi:hypothetical protein